MNRIFFIFFCLFVLASCASYKSNVMLQPTELHKPEIIKKEIANTEKNYVIQKNDLLQLTVDSNKGEKIVNPNPELTSTNTTSNSNEERPITYLVDLNGIVKFPMIGELKLEGLTLRQAEEIAQKEYSNYFKDPFVIINYTNKRVVLLGAPGGQVIPLTNQNVTLIEVLSLAKGLEKNAIAYNMKLIRKETIYQIDFSTIDGFKEGNMIIEPGDVIYVEPIRRPFTEALQDNFIFISLLVSLTTLIAILAK